MNEPTFGNREVLIKSRVGSWNYNLQSETSDEDYKYFICPNIDDLYHNNFCSHATITSMKFDYDAHDIRKFVELVWKSNLSYLEVLYSNKIEYNHVLKPIFENRDELVKMNLSGFYSSCHGMYNQKMKNMFKGTETTKPDVDRCGYDPKCALHAYRILDFVDKFTGGNFEKSLRYDGSQREELLVIKNGLIPYEDVSKMISIKYEKFLKLEEFYKTKTQNKELYKWLFEEVKKIVISIIIFETDFNQ